MGTIMVTYRGHIVGFCTARHAQLTHDLDAELDGERVGPFYLAMCLCAMEILRDPRLPRYTERRARRFAHTMLIPEEILEHPADFNLGATARWSDYPSASSKLPRALGADAPEPPTHVRPIAPAVDDVPLDLRRPRITLAACELLAA